jgi:hypothetical protein
LHALLVDHQADLYSLTEKWDKFKSNAFKSFFRAKAASVEENVHVAALSFEELYEKTTHLVNMKFIGPKEIPLFFVNWSKENFSDEYLKKFNIHKDGYLLSLV